MSLTYTPYVYPVSGNEDEVYTQLGSTSGQTVASGYQWGYQYPSCNCELNCGGGPCGYIFITYPKGANGCTSTECTYLDPNFNPQTGSTHQYTVEYLPSTTACDPVAGPCLFWYYDSNLIMQAYKPGTTPVNSYNTGDMGSLANQMMGGYNNPETNTSVQVALNGKWYLYNGSELDNGQYNGGSVDSV